MMTSAHGHRTSGAWGQVTVAVAGCVAIGAGWLLLPDPSGRSQFLLLLMPLPCLLMPLANAPFGLVLTFIVLSYFRLPEVFPALYPLHLPQIVAICTLAALAWHMFGTRRLRPFWTPELSLFALFFVLVTMGVAFATNRPLAFDYWSSTYVKIGIMALATVWLSVGRRQFALASHVFVVTGLIVGLVALSNKINHVGLVEGTRVTIGRDIGSILGDPNDLALVLLFPVSFALGLATTRCLGAVSRLLGTLGCVVLALAILATQSRGGLLGLAAVVIPFVGRRIRSKAVLIGLAFFGTVALFSVADISNRTIVAAAGEGLDDSAEGRLQAWRAAFSMALARPLNGVGLDNFVDSYFFYTDEWQGHSIAAHSTWCEVLAETGFPGFGVYVAMIMLTTRNLLRASRRLHNTIADPSIRATVMSLIAGILGFAVSGTFLSQAFTWPIYILLALSVAMSRYAANIGHEVSEPGAAGQGPEREGHRHAQG